MGKRDDATRCSDAALVDLARRGDQDAFARLAHRKRRVIEAACASVVLDPHLREDAVQLALIDIWKGIGGFKGEASVSTWIYRVTRNAALRSVTRRTGRFETPTEVVEQLPAHEDGWCDAAATRAVILDAIDDMPDPQREALLLHAQAGWPISEIATVLGSPAGTVKCWIHRARAEIASQLRDSL